MIRQLGFVYLATFVICLTLVYFLVGIVSSFGVLVQFAVCLVGSVASAFIAGSMSLLAQSFSDREAESLAEPTPWNEEAVVEVVQSPGKSREAILLIDGPDRYQVWLRTVGRQDSALELVAWVLLKSSDGVVGLEWRNEVDLSILHSTGAVMMERRVKSFQSQPGEMLVTL